MTACRFIESEDCGHAYPACLRVRDVPTLEHGAVRVIDCAVCGRCCYPVPRAMADFDPKSWLDDDEIEFTRKNGTSEP